MTCYAVMLWRDCWIQSMSPAVRSHHSTALTRDRVAPLHSQDAMEASRPGPLTSNSQTLATAVGSHSLAVNLAKADIYLACLPDPGSFNAHRPKDPLQPPYSNTVNDYITRRSQVKRRGGCISKEYAYQLTRTTQLHLLRPRTMSRLLGHGRFLARAGRTGWSVDW